MRKAAYCLLDAFGLAIVASAERTFRAFLETCSPIGAGTGRGRLWHGGSWHTLAEAVEGNAILAHAHFHDDSEYSSWSHPASLIVPVATTLGDSTGASVDRVLRAIVAGYSAINWLGAEETVALAMIHRGVRTSPTLGAIAAAASASVLLDLDAERSASAAGIAASITGGLLEPVRTGSDEWRVQNAHAARAGLLAAQLAGGGVRGARSALEGPKGLLAAYAGMNALPDRWKSDPDPQTIVSHVVAKPYATLGDNMAAAIAAKLLFEDGVDIDAIAGIRVSLWRHYYEYPGTSYRGPFDETAQALASTVFAVAPCWYAANWNSTSTATGARIPGSCVWPPSPRSSPTMSATPRTAWSRSRSRTAAADREIPGKGQGPSSTTTIRPRSPSSDGASPPAGSRRSGARPSGKGSWMEPGRCERCLTACSTQHDGFEARHTLASPPPRGPARLKRGRTFARSIDYRFRDAFGA
jgi:hypothetical protein